jgi:hypothetical protein
LSDVTTSTSFTRTNVDVSIKLSIPTGRIVANGFLIISLPDVEDIQFVKTTNPCTITRDDDSTGTNFAAASGCEVISGGRFKMNFASADAGNTAGKLYTIKVSSVPAPSHPK